MRLYRVTANRSGHAATKFVGTRADVAKAKDEFAEKYGVRRNADTSFEEVDVPTDKAGLLAFLNAELGN